MDKKETICAVVVTYNRKELLLESLDSLLKQTYLLDAIHIIDNASVDGTPQILREKGYIKEILEPLDEPLESENIINMFSEGNQDKEVRIHYVRMHKNTGGAGGFYEGVKRGYEKDYDWLWLMDDDVKAEKECLFNLLSYFRNSSRRVFVLQTTRMNLDGKVVNWFPYFSFLTLRSRNSTPEKSNCVYFEGLFIHRKIVEIIGFPNKDLFIVGDDIDYGLKISKISKIKFIKSAVLFRLIPYSSSNRTIYQRYYFFRNIFLISRLHNIPLYWTTIVVFIQIIFSISKTILFEKNKIYKSKLILRAFFDGLIGKYGEA